MKIINKMALAALLLLAACNPATTTETETATATEAVIEQTAPVSGISFFEGSWSQALAKAKEENKLIFLDISASWCGPCKQLKKNTFTDASVGELYNSQFINVEVDGEIGEGITLAEQFKIEGYPTLLFVNGDGNIVSQSTGFLPPDQFIQFGKSVSQ